MNIFDLPPLAALLDLASSAFTAVTALLAPVAGAGAAAAAIVLVTLIVRAVLIPVGISQARAEQTRARLTPLLAQLRKRHRDDPERLRRETLKLYSDEGVSPFAGCLPVLAQAPVVGLIYAVFLHPMISGHPNPLLNETLFGVPLGTGLVHAVGAGVANPAALLVIGVVAAAIAAVGELTRRMLRPPAPAGDTAMPPALVPALGVLQFATAVVSLFVPLAAGIYLLVTVTCTLVQRLILRRVYPLTPG